MTSEPGAPPPRPAPATAAARVDALERASRAVATNIPRAALTSAHARVEAALLASRVVGSALYRVPADYYDWPLARRGKELACTPERLCKTIVLENATAPNPGAVGDVSLLPLGQQRYIAVLLQYVTKLDTAALERALRAHGAVGEPRLRQAPDAVALTGFGFGAITPVGSATPLPVVVAKPIACLPPPSYVWLGGGEVDTKLRMFTAQLLRPGGCSPGYTAVVLDCVEARDGEDGEGGDAG